MGLLLAPYNNAMRIGQGFNSYTQEICVDDAVVKDPERAVNQVTNDGWTMEQIKQAMQGQQDELQIENLAQSALDAEFQKTLDEYNERHPSTSSSGPKVKGSSAGSAGSSADGDAYVMIPDNESEEDRIKRENSELAKANAKRKQEGKALATNAATLDAGDEIALSTRTAASLLDLKPTKHYAYVKSGRRGPSQIVTYTSRFVNKVSDITDDMNISGSLSIKYNMIGGSGRGVVNQTINEVDYLRYNKLSNNELSGDDFRKVFGDSFVSGFIEGGEFNAVVSMKILNKEKKTNIAASAKVALTVGPAAIEASGNVNIAKENLEANTETTYQVSWSGGGHLKNTESQWNLDTIAEVASRFADLAAITPQRTYAILTKYESLRSFQESKPKLLPALFYENATLYTNTMLDAFMEYKAMYKRISEEIFEIQGGSRQMGSSRLPKTSGTSVLAIAPSITDDLPAGTEGASQELVPLDLKRVEDSTPFPASVQGLDMARRGIRFQMNKIVTEVDRITLKPELATAEDLKEAFQSPTIFRERVPATRLIRRGPSAPLAVSLIRTDTKDSDEESDILPLYVEATPLDPNSLALYDRIMLEMPAAGKSLRMSELYGSSPAPTPSEPSTAFNDLIFVKPDFLIQRIEAQVFEGCLTGVGILYANGLKVSHGNIRRDEQGLKAIRSLTLALHRKEKIISCSIETGTKQLSTKDNAPVFDMNTRVTGLKLFTNRGQTLVSQGVIGFTQEKEQTRDGRRYKDLKSVDLDPLLQDGHLKSFWGYSSLPTDDQVPGVLSGLGAVWGTYFEYNGPDIIIPADTTTGATNKQPGLMSLCPGWSLTEIPDTSTMSITGTCTIASASRIATVVDIWWVADNGSVQTASIQDGMKCLRVELSPPGTAAQGAISAASTSPNNYEVIWTTPEGALQLATYRADVNGWTRKQLRPNGSATPGAGLSILSRMPTNAEACWISPTGSVEQAYMYTTTNDGQWSFRQMAPSHSASLRSNVQSLSINKDRMHFAWSGPEGSIYMAGWGPGDWVVKEQLPKGTILADSVISLSSRSFASLDLHWISQSGSVEAALLDLATGGLTAWQDKPANSASLETGLKSLSVTSASVDAPLRRHLIYVGTDGSIHGKSSLPAGTTTEYEIAPANMAVLGTPIAAISRRPDLIEAWFKTTSNTAVLATWRP